MNRFVLIIASRDIIRMIKFFMWFAGISTVLFVVAVIRIMVEVAQ